MQLKVYYLDDEKALCDVFYDSYSSEDIVVEIFTEPETLLKQSASSPPDIFFLDYRLPSTNGEELAELLDQRIPKVLVTGDLQINVTYPFLKVLSKPWKDQDVRTILDLIKTERSKDTGGLSTMAAPNDDSPHTQQVEAKGSLASVVREVTHDINGSLAVIKLRTHQIRSIIEKNLPLERVIEFANIIEEAVDDVSVAISELRGASQSGERAPQRKKVQ